MGTCGASCGITKEREKDLLRARAAAERAHPGFSWSRARAFTPPAVTHDALVDLARKLEAILPVRVLVRAGDRGECDSLYVLAGLHRPSLCEIKDALDPPSAPAACALRETYVRVAISPHGRFAVLQEVVFSAEPADEGLTIVEEPQAGVVDRRLQHIIKGLQGALRKAKLVVLDLAAVLRPIEGATRSAELAVCFDEPVSLWSLLFEGLSPMATRATWAPSMVGLHCEEASLPVG